MVGQILNLVVTTIFWALTIVFLKKFLYNQDKKFVNTILMSVVSGFYFVELLYVIIFKGVFWGYSPLQNFSPLLFTLSFVTIFLPAEWQRKMFGFFAIFCPAMFVAAYAPSIAEIAKNSTSITLATFLDSLAHISFGIFTFYLLRTGQVSITKYNLGMYVVNCLVVVIAIILINLVFHTTFFGLVFFGEPNIYSVTISNSGFVSNTIYILGMIFVLLLGYIFASFVSSKSIKSQILDKKPVEK